MVRAKTFNCEAMKDRAKTVEERVVQLLEERHVGRKNAIKARILADRVGESERVVRAAISQARKDGVLILSAISPPYGYFVAENREEWQEFRHKNLRSRALDILETDRAMAQAARERFGPAVQLVLFADMPEMVA